MEQAELNRLFDPLGAHLARKGYIFQKMEPAEALHDQERLVMSKVIGVIGPDGEKVELLFRHKGEQKDGGSAEETSMLVIHYKVNNEIDGVSYYTLGEVEALIADEEEIVRQAA